MLVWMLSLQTAFGSHTDTVIAGVIQDAKFKRREALADLAKSAEKK